MYASCTVNVNRGNSNPTSYAGHRVIKDNLPPYSALSPTQKQPTKVFVEKNTIGEGSQGGAVIEMAVEGPVEGHAARILPGKKQEICAAVRYQKRGWCRLISRGTNSVVGENRVRKRGKDRVN